MTTRLDGVTNKGKDKPEPSAEQKLAVELVALDPAGRGWHDGPCGGSQP